MREDRTLSKTELSDVRAAELRAAIAANSLQEKCSRRLSSSYNILEISIPKRADSQDESSSRAMPGSRAAMAEQRSRELTEAIRGQQVLSAPSLESL